MDLPPPVADPDGQGEWVASRNTDGEPTPVLPLHLSCLLAGAEAAASQGGSIG